MSQIKLKHSGGNGVIIAAPSSNPSADRTLLLPGDGNSTIDTLIRAGNPLQFVNSTQASFSTTSTNTFVDVTGATLSLTPTTSSNKILLIFSCYIFTNLVGGNNVRGNVKMLRDSTQINFSVHAAGDSSGGLQTKQTCTQMVIDAPGDTSAHTYKMQACNTNTSSTPTLGLNDATFMALEIAA
jgi:hypothetical protein|tara:strand:+ start:296 stop:844 length:549 start_codon:yes stop_codon:yes gene_type:complete